MIKISIEISGETPDELTDKMYALTQRFNSLQLSGEAEETVAAPAKPVKPAAASAKPAAAAAPKKPAAAAAKKPAPAAEPDPALLDYAADVAPMVMRVANEISRDAALEVLSGFGVAKATQLSPEQYPEFVAALQAKLDEALA